MLPIHRLVTHVLLFALGFALLVPASLAGTLLLDPAIRHTNGLPTASSSPLRNSSVQWTCNPDKLGWCGGEYYIPCLDSIRPARIVADCRRQDPSCCNAQTGLHTARSPGTPDGMETTGMVNLGTIPNDGLASGMLGSPAMGGGMGLGNAPPPRPRRP